MADIHHSVLGLLVTVLYLLTGVSGETLSMFSRVGDDVSLPCNNVVYPDCSSTTWNFNRAGSTGTIEEVAFGKIKVDKTERAERLSLGSDCSLHVSNVRAEDAGLYTCQQFLTKNGPQHGGDALTRLSVQTRNTASTARPAFSTISPSSAGFQTLILTMGVGVAMGAAVCVVAAVIIAHRRRTKTQMTADDSISLYAVNHSTPPTNDDTSQPVDRITYSSIDHFHQNPHHRVDVSEAILNIL
uniref:Ig-like domain-containing protein n=1 Tax=Hucho hucho TaxID=62062 RepID=A0A4W5KA60_9TELE